MPDVHQPEFTLDPEAAAFVRSVTALQAVGGYPDIVLHLSTDLEQCWSAVARYQSDQEQPIPFWAFAWAGGLAIAHLLRDHPEYACGRRVLDLATGSGLCAIAACRAGANLVWAADIDHLAATAVLLNALANGVEIRSVCQNLLAQPPPPVDLILAGDIGYEPELAREMMSWLRQAADSGISVLIGDPGRRYFPREQMQQLALYEIETSRELESDCRMMSGVYTFPDF